jgi:TolB-like protein/Tfp pilus assembly protein PilF/tRNA A-37 threonylcarbamoyl transferase component Bud32
LNEHIDRLNAALRGRYTIQRELGAGGMATVYLAEDLKHRRQVAIKVLRPELSATIGPERFVREIEIAANLNHPHVLPLHDSGEADGLLYYVMPFVEGESLRDRLVRDHKLSVSDAVRITDQVASALSYAHERGVVHRDIKPENILLAGDQAIVADFGIARAVEVAGGEKLTGTGIAVGTPAYMSPEQAVGDTNVDARSDVYAMGCVVYEMVTGRAPFEGETPQALLAKHAVNTVPSLRTADSSIPLFLERAVGRALAKQPADRFQTASAFAEALTSEMVVARVGGRRWPRLAVSAATIVVLAAAALVLSNVLGGPAYERLAVLPPANLMNDPDQEYFVAGVHYALISELQRAGVAVIARTSVMRYENTQMLAREIAQELGVDALIEASVMRAGDSVEIEVSLVDGTTQEYVADPIVRRSTLRDAERLYRGLTAAIATEIQFALTPQAEAHLASSREVNPQAYEAYLKGQFHYQRLTPTDVNQAFEYFQQALVLDSTYAPAQAGIALVWVWRGALWLTPPREAAPQASAAVQQALALDSTLAQVQYAVSQVRNDEWDWEGVEAGYRKAIEINPNYVDARALYGAFLAIMERPEEARAQMDRALELDPFNPMVRLCNAGVLGYERRYAEVIQEYEAILRIVADHPLAYVNLAWAYHMTGNYDEALAMLRRSFAGDQELDEALDRGYAQGGYQAALRRYAETLAARPEAAGRLAWPIAGAYAWAGDKERTLEWLERAYQAHDASLMTANTTDFELVHDDPRYRDLRRRMGLPER